MPTVMPERIVAVPHRPIVQHRVTRSLTTAVRPIRPRVIRLRVHQGRRRATAAIRRTQRHPIAALPRPGRIAREEAMVELAEVAVLAAVIRAAAVVVVVIPAPAAEAAAVREAVRRAAVR